MARRPPAAIPPRRVLNKREMQRGIEKIKQKISDLENFSVIQIVTADNPPELFALETSIERMLEKIFGEKTSDFTRFSDAARLHFRPMIFGDNYPLVHHYRSHIEERLRSSRLLLSEAIKSLEEDISEIEEGVEVEQAAKNVTHKELSDKIFIVHGRDDGTKETIARFVTQAGFDPIILHERPNKGRTIIAKFREEASDVGFAIIIMTPDDQGGMIGGEVSPRARQNVVFELGFFIGALRPERVAALVKGKIERPSDFDGVVYISLDSGDWKMQLGKELQAAGYKIDWNKIMK